MISRAPQHHGLFLPCYLNNFASLFREALVIALSYKVLGRIYVKVTHYYFQISMTVPYYKNFDPAEKFVTFSVHVNSE